MSDAIKAALVAAGKQFCICDGECFETRHGMMHGPCEQPRHQTAAAVAAFLRALPDPASPEGFEAYRSLGRHESFRLWLAAAVERAAREAGDER